MKLQHVTVMFIIIFMPILMVTSYFISLQVETIKLESSYDEKLLKATHDAMTSFELNTANEDLSSVADSLRSIIDASNNIFFNTLCTNMGVSNASKSFVQPFIPAILYTLYDGYYIYSPTNTPEICTDKYGRTIRTSDFGVTYKNSKMVNGKKCGFYNFNNDDIEYDKNTPTEPVGGRSFVKYDELSGNGLEQEYGQILYKNKDGSYSTQLHTFTGADVNLSTYYKRSYILKSYIPYSARYSDDGYDITINYTLDNFMTVEGKIGDIYYTKSGYLIKKDLVQKISVINRSGESQEISSWTTYSKDVLDSYIYDPSNYTVIVELSEGITISNKDGCVDVSNGEGSGSTTVYWDDAQSAVKYYVDSYIFSSWFYENFSDISEKNLTNTGYSVADINEAGTSVAYDTSLQNNMLYDFSSSNIKPFDISNDPENLESDFCKHKRNVIKNSITYNLILSMVVYTEESRTVEFNMPVFKESEWDSILNNVSIVSFMEGLRCGLKYYNNYAIVTSTNNEISVTDNEIYYVPRTVQTIDEVSGTQIVSNLEDNFGDEIAHRIDCEELNLGGADNFYMGNWLGCISFKSKEIKYDKILEKDGTYTYDHKAYTDYDCIVDSNYKVENVDETEEDGNTDVLGYLLKNTTDVIDSDLQKSLKFKLKAYRIAIAKERNNLYKTTAFPENYGWQFMNLPVPIICGSRLNLSGLGGLTKNKLSEIEKIEVTIINSSTTQSGIYTDNVRATYHLDGAGDQSYSETQTISTTSKNRRTLEFKQDFDSDGTVGSITISPENDNTTFNVESIKVYFK